MQIAYLAVSLIIVSGGSASEPQIIPQGFYSRAGCVEWKANMDRQRLPTVDPASGRALLSRKFVCQPVDLKDLSRMISSYEE
jgi:hypothetical protein